MTPTKDKCEDGGEHDWRDMGNPPIGINICRKCGSTADESGGFNVPIGEVQPKLLLGADTDGTVKLFQVYSDGRKIPVSCDDGWEQWLNVQKHVGATPGEMIAVVFLRDKEEAKR